MKIERFGWVAKDTKKTDIICIRNIGGFSEWELEVYCHKGKKETWRDEDWPPIKVKITIERV